MAKTGEEKSQHHSYCLVLECLPCATEKTLCFKGSHNFSAACSLVTQETCLKDAWWDCPQVRDKVRL